MPVDIKRKFFASTNYTLAADFHPTQPWLLTGHASGIVTFYNLESGKIIHSFSLSFVTCVKFIARKNWYAVGSADDVLSVFNCTTHEKVIAFEAHTRDITCLAVHPVASIVLTGSRDKTIKAWNWDKQWHNVQTYQGHTNWIRSITFNPKDPDTFASASDDGTVKMWFITSPVPDFTIKAHEKDVNFVDFYSGTDKPYLVTASDDRTIKIWDYLSQSCIQTMNGHTSIIVFAVFHPNLPIIISGSWDGTVKIWNCETYEIEHTLSYGLGCAKCIALHKDTSEIVVGFDEAVLALEFVHSGPLQMAESRGDMSSEAESEERVLKVLEGRDMKETAVSISTGPDPELDSLETAFDTTLSLSPTSYEQCATLTMELIAAKTTYKLISELLDDKAQDMADFLSKIVSDEETFTQRDRKYTLRLLSKLAKSAAVFPRALVLKGAQCNLANPVAWGGYGVIYKGEHEGSLICVKAVQADSQGINEEKLRAHAGELTIWGHLRHPNVLPFLGIYASKEDVPRICIVSPWMNNGDLLQYLKTVPEIPRKPLVRDIISGLQYLHDLDIIHADLKAKNVLVSETGKAMLADFGISRLSITLTTILTNVSIGTAYWMAPELHLDDEPSPSRASDIWSFGCTCYEIITGMTPFGQYRNPVMLIGAFMRGKIIPKKPETPGIGWDEDVWSVAMRCWQSNPASRPKAHELLDVINGFDSTDHRSSDPESHQRSYPNIDYDRIFGILNEICQSAAV